MTAKNPEICTRPGRCLNASGVAQCIRNHFKRWCAPLLHIYFFPSSLFIRLAFLFIPVCLRLRCNPECQMSHKQEITRSVNKFCGSKAAKQLKQPTHCWSIVCMFPLLVFSVQCIWCVCVCVCAALSLTRSPVVSTVLHLAMTLISSVWCEAMSANRKKYKKAAKLTGILNEIQSYAVKLYIYTLQVYGICGEAQKSKNSNNTFLLLCAWLFHRTQF